MSIPKTYNPKEVEDKWYATWLERGFFKSKPNPKKQPYTVVIPPPNVTGVLHMGHMLNNTIQDVLVRRARMQGKEACWVPGTDHASIATEARVVAMLKEKGISKSDLTREEFLQHAFEWKEKYGGIILEQLKKLGASCDWDRTRFTMEPALTDAVIQVFVDLYRKGQIYRGVRMVNWDPQGMTALSDEEVNFKQVNGKLYYLRYAIEGSDEVLTVATKRPETIMGDVAICVHPEDPRYQHLAGQKAIIPLVNRAIPIIFDEYVDREFGTGVLKVTPAHDINDYELGQKHNLPSIDVLNDNGTIHERAGLYVGEDRFVVRKKITKDLDAQGLLEKVEDSVSNVGFSERTDAVIEPKLSMQWWCKMDAMAKPALENVMNDTIKLHPAKFKNMYRSWMENVHDWCISRQLWWGQQIPAYYLPDGTFVVARTAQEALEEARAKTGNPELQLTDLRQDEDVLDTWFSSWLWPISVFDGFQDPDNEDINYYYPTNDLVTAPEILFFWVARMIMAGYEFRKELPFQNVYLTGIVRDAQGRKMSKSLGNSPDPLVLIEQYGADGVRAGMLFSSPAGNDLLFDEKLCEQGRNFSNKIWNAFRLINGWEVEENLENPNEKAIKWFDSKFNEALNVLEDHFDKFRISDALLTVYKLVWDDFCSNYLEMIKPAFGSPIDTDTWQATNEFLEKLMKVLHPFMPFITEEIWNSMKERAPKDCLVVAAWPEKGRIEADLLKQTEYVLNVVGQIRNQRNSKNISPAKKLALYVRLAEGKSAIAGYETLVSKLANLSEIQETEQPLDNSLSFVVESAEFFIPMEGNIDAAAERERILKELDYTKGFLASVAKKLSNERFVSGAPEAVITAERKKQSDAEAKIAALEQSLSALPAE
ncbi:valine--tRNA ligase [Rufibacter glacialis]|uniref:Valine--tRNA ligase n=1 Tax=Rufibacter glacialis TaxID=1259555 RepID=A0A5M8QKS9_9BACT|nr:valine--tRNA ligase [Rufibacter glacialis]KAA6435590.1 valine--tRNA ligase [Rufibacter glacialis]GGK64815.1 valine--tRNA ligase [Rufibacter glacialis]